MKNNIILLVIISFIFQFSLQAQFLNCPESEHSALCDINDIDGTIFTSPNPQSSDVPTEPLCIDGVFHNPGFFSFVAGSNAVEILVTPLPMTCDTTQGGQSGIQSVLWFGCPSTDGYCVAGNSDCQDTPLVLYASDLIVGEIYNLVIDGCGESICTVEIDILSATEFKLPDLDTIDLSEPMYNIRASCDNSLGEGNFCTQFPVHFEIDDEFYKSLLAEYTWTVSGPSIDDIEWEIENFFGIGPPFIAGDLNDELGENGINMEFQEPGTYTICINNVSTECDRDTNGEACTTITIIQPGEQDFGTYEVCALDLLTGWNPTDHNVETTNEIPWMSGVISLDDVENAEDGILSIVTQDDCGCDFQQNIQVLVSGSIDREEIELYLWECMLPYTWFGEEFIDIDSLPIFNDINLRGGSAQSNYDGMNCDSLVNITVIPLTFKDTIIVGNESPTETEYIFKYSALDPYGNTIELSNVLVEWIDSSTNIVVSSDTTALLPTGSYYVNFTSTLEDLNYRIDSLADISLFAECNMQFGPYYLVSGTSSSSELSEDDVSSDMFTIHPNPFFDILNVSVQSEEKIQEFYIVDALGKKVSLRNQIDLSKLKLEELPVGIYFAYMKFKSERVVVKKVVKM